MSMKQVTPEMIARVTGGEYIGPEDIRAESVTSVSTDSRAVERGGLFVCIRGARVDGHDYAVSAVRERGALVCLAERTVDAPHILVPSAADALRALAEWYRQLFDIPVVGIIGSVGKTTTKELTAAALGRKYRVLKTPANLNNEIGVPLTLLSMGEEHQAAVIEMGISDFGEMRTLARMVRPDICVMTAIGYCHLEKLGNLNGVLRAKSEVFEFMGPDKLAVLNGDDGTLRDFDPGVRTVTYGINSGRDCDVWAEDVKSRGFDGLTFDICRAGSRVRASVPAFGTHIAYGALAAAVVGYELGMDGEDIAAGLAEYRPVGGRANVTDTGYLTVIDDCYNANPNSMAAAIASLGSAKPSEGCPYGKRVAVLGDMKELGADSSELHRAVGEIAAIRGIEAVLCCGVEAKAIYDGYVAAGGGKAVYYRQKDALLDDISRHLDRGDIVLVKASHSMEFEDVVKALKRIKL